MANSTWGSWMAELGVPGIYRSQASMAPGREGAHGHQALPHAGIGVSSIRGPRRPCAATPTWSTSGRSLPAPATAPRLRWPHRSPQDADLFSIISSFDAAYSAWQRLPGGMERFWTLKYIEQNGITELTAAVIKEGRAAAFWCGRTTFRWSSRAGRKTYSGRA